MREIIYNITKKVTGRRISLTDLTEEFTKDNLLGIINKTQGEVLYTPLQLGNIQSFQYQNGSILITLSASVPIINAGDELFVKLYSKNDIDLSHIAKEQTLNDGVITLSSKIDNIDLSSIENKVNTESQAIKDKIDAIPSTDLTSVAKEDTLNTKADEIKQAVKNIDLTSVENKVQEGVNFLSVLIDNLDLSAVENKVKEESATIQAKIEDIELPEIDTTELAKQGENQEATNTAILEGINRILSRSVVYNSSTGDLTFENVDIIIE